MKINRRNCWPALILALALLWGTLPVLAGASLPEDTGHVVELGPSEYDVPVTIVDPPVPVGLEWPAASQWTFGFVVPVFLGVATVGFPSITS